MISPYPAWDGIPSESESREQLHIATPELVAIEFPLAGIGSRFVAILLDYLLQGLTLGLLVLVIVLIASGSRSTPPARNSASAEKWAIAILIAIPFLLQWGYFTLFEFFWRGQTPGKRVMKLRVIQQTGRPLGLLESMGRNLLRAIDMLPAFYVVGVVTMFLTRRQQRLGDLLAGSLVVHEQPEDHAGDTVASARTFTAAVFEQAPVTAPPLREISLPADAVARLGLADLQALESYLARRLDVPMEVRAQLAGKLAENVARKMQFSPPVGMSQEKFLEEAAFALRGLRHLR